MRNSRRGAKAAMTDPGRLTRGGSLLYTGPGLPMIRHRCAGRSLTPDHLCIAVFRRRIDDADERKRRARKR